MRYTDRIESRKRLRLRGYDYRMGGYYYVTLCTQNRRCLFGKIENGKMILNNSGLMVHDVWLDMASRYNEFQNDLFVVMPNHLHGILIMYGKTWSARGSVSALSLPDVIRNFKALTTTRYIRGVKEDKFEPFEKKLWQRSYYEHIIRKNEVLDAIRQYIVDNPKKWEEDRQNSRLLCGALPIATQELSATVINCANASFPRI